CTAKPIWKRRWRRAPCPRTPPPRCAPTSRARAPRRRWTRSISGSSPGSTT
ncbi:MAG: hypothetical protein AVDCRST_MAG39-2034, partial [uncultured Sphingomonadaceae bacterium]